MFAALASILAPNQTLDLAITLAADGRMKVIVKPQLIKGSNPSLAIPLALAATPQELDAEFVGSLMQYAGERTSLQQQIDVTTTIIAQAKASEVGKATKALKSNSTASPSAKPDGEAVGGADDNGGVGGDDFLGDAQPTSTSEPTPPVPAAQPAPAPAATNDDLLSALM